MPDAHCGCLRGLAMSPSRINKWPNQTTVYTPLNSPITSLLALIFLHGMDMKISKEGRR